MRIERFKSLYWLVVIGLYDAIRQKFREVLHEGY